MTNLIKYEIPATHIESTDQLAEQIRETHQQFPEAPDERSLAMQGLLSRTKTQEGQPVNERVLEDITDPANQSAGAERRRSLLAGSVRSGSRHDSFEVHVDEETGEVQDAFFVRRLPVDRKATVRAQRISDQTPSGPSKNGSSFRTGVIDPSKRR